MFQKGFQVLKTFEKVHSVHLKLFQQKVPGINSETILKSSTSPFKIVPKKVPRFTSENILKSSVGPFENVP